MRGRRCINRRCIHSPPSARRHSFELPSTYINLKCQACLPRLTNQCLVKTLTAEGINRRNVSSPMNGSPVICDLLEARKGRSRLTFSDVLLVYVERPCWKHQLDFSHCLVGLLVQLVEQHIHDVHQQNLVLCGPSGEAGWPRKFLVS